MKAAADSVWATQGAYRSIGLPIRSYHDSVDHDRHETSRNLTLYSNNNVLRAFADCRTKTNVPEPKISVVDQEKDASQSKAGPIHLARQDSLARQTTELSVISYQTKDLPP